MNITIETPQGNQALREFVLFYDQAHEYRQARWPAPLELQLPLLEGKGPFRKGKVCGRFSRVRTAKS